RDRLRDSYLAQARAGRAGHQSGQRLASLEALQRAAAIRPGADLRDEAITCMTLADLRIPPPGAGPDDPAVLVHGWRFDPEPGGTVTIVHQRQKKQLAQLPSKRGKVRFCLPSKDGRFVLVVHGADEQSTHVVWDWKAGRVVLEARQ